jgi:hypothetical protein
LIVETTNRFQHENTKERKHEIQIHKNSFAISFFRFFVVNNTNSNSNLRLDIRLNWQLFQENGILSAYRETASGLLGYLFGLGISRF